MRTIRFLLIACMLTSVTPAFSQLVKTKDGVSLGKRKHFISSCTSGADKKTLEINGLSIRADKYCACVCDNLIPTINSWEIEKALSESTLTELFLADGNLEIIMQCLEGNYQISDDYVFGQSGNTELQREIGIKGCVAEIMKNEETNQIFTRATAEEYCTCAIDKMLSAGYSYKDIAQIEDQHSSAFNEVAVPCMAQALKANQEFASSNSYHANDIQGGDSRSMIPLVDVFGRSYRLKINIAGVSKYFLFDTGASDLIIDSATEKELLANGGLKKEHYLNKTEYTLANNQTVVGQKVRVDNIVIGDYTVNNVVIAIIENGSLLCGKSFLDKFEKWEIDKQNNVLILYK